MNVFDKIRIKLKIKKMCRIIYLLPESEQDECVKKILHCLRSTDDWEKKECFLDMFMERFSTICR